MSNEVMVAEATTTQVAEVFNYEEKAKEYLQSMGNKLPAKQLTQFIEMAKAFQLNPFKREIYAVGYGENWNIITGYEVYLKRAERTAKLDGWKCDVEGSGENMRATVTIYRKDWSHPFTHTVLFSEVCQKTKDGKLNSVWAKQTSFMTKKVAIAQGFRLCFPDEFSGMPYTSDEMPNEEQLRDVTPTSEQLAEQALKIAKPATPVKEKLYTREESEKVKELLTAKYQDGTDIFTEEDKKVFRKLIVEQGGKACIESVERTIEERVGTWKDQKDAEELQNAAEGIF